MIATGKLIERIPEKGQFFQLVPDHEVRQIAAIDAFFPDREHHVHAHAVRA